MLVSKNSIKIILLLIFVLVIFQISKSSPKNYLAYSLVAIGFYLVYTEINVSNQKVENMDNSQNEAPVSGQNTTPVIIEEQEESNNNDTEDLMKKALELEQDRTMELEELKKSLVQPESKEEDSCDCNSAIAKAIAPLQAEVSKLRDAQKVSVNETEAKLKTYQLLVEHLMEKDVLNKEDIETLQSKLTSGVLTVDETISRLEKMKLASASIERKQPVESNKNWWSEMNKSELPAAMYLPLGSQINSDFSNDYTILNTEKWTVPMPRPPVCINSAPKEIMPVGTTGYPLSVKYFDDARYVSTSAAQEKTKKDLEDKL